MYSSAECDIRENFRFSLVLVLRLNFSIHVIINVENDNSLFSLKVKFAIIYSILSQQHFFELILRSAAFNGFVFSLACPGKMK